MNKWNWRIICRSAPYLLPQGLRLVPPNEPHGRGLHSFTFQLNVSALHGIGGAFWGYLVGVYKVSGGVRACVRIINGSS